MRRPYPPFAAVLLTIFALAPSARILGQAQRDTARADAAPPIVLAQMNDGMPSPYAAPDNSDNQDNSASGDDQNADGDNANANEDNGDNNDNGDQQAQPDANGDSGDQDNSDQNSDQQNDDSQSGPSDN